MRLFFGFVCIFYTSIAFAETQSLLLGKKNLTSLLLEREEILRNYSNYVDHDANWYKADLLVDGVATAVKVRLKGDSILHYAAELPSLRVRFKDPSSRYMEVDLMQASFRSFHWDILVRQMLAQTRILIPQMKLIDFNIMGVQKPFIMEELLPYDKMENYARRDGLVFAFDDGLATSNLEKYYQSESEIDARNIFSLQYMKPKIKGPLNFSSDVYSTALLTLANTLRASRANSIGYDPEIFGEYLAHAEFWCAAHTTYLHNIRLFWDPAAQSFSPIWWDARPGSCANSIFRSEFALILLSNEEILASFKRNFNNLYSVREKLFDTLRRNQIDMRSYDFPEFPAALIQSSIEQRYSHIRSLELSEIVEMLQTIRKTSARSGKILGLQKSSIVPIRRVEYDAEIGEDYSTFHCSNRKSNLYEFNFTKLDFERADYEKKSKKTCLEADLEQTESGVEFLTFKVKQSDFNRLEAITKQNSKIPRLDGTENFIEEDIIVLPGETLTLQPGTKLNFAEGAGVYVYGQIKVLGTSERPVTIKGVKNSTWAGLHVLNTNYLKKRSNKVSHLNVINAARSSRDTCVTFVNTKVDIDGLSIDNCAAEDSLNMIYTDAKINDLSISGAESDGFDADFSKIFLERGRFIDIGGDALDFSGSTIEIISSDMSKITDKAISIGELSNGYLSNVQIKDVDFGIVVKDGSDIVAKSISASEIRKYTYATYIKKKYLGGSSLTVKNAEPGYSYLSQKNTTLRIDNVLKDSIKLNVADLY